MSDSFFLDGKEIPFQPGETILKAALKAGHFIPHYCYHPSLSYAATCRMCLVDVVDAGVGKPLPKLQTSCSMPAQGGAKIETTNKRVFEARRAVMEFLLINHPLDCVICDQSGECDLQDFSFEYGSGISMVQHEKRVYGPRDIGSFLELERNRCIHCTRCVRFSQEITKTSELGTFGRAHQLTVDTFIDQPLSDPFQGNLADICPVGAITLKDFRFKKRVWKLTTVPSICDQCATGCNVNLDHEDGKVYRIKPRENQEVNRWWMCDYGRINFHDYYNPEKLQQDCTAASVAIKPEEATAQLVDILQSGWDNLYFINSGHSTLEEAFSLKMFGNIFAPNADLYYPKPAPEKNSASNWINNLISEDKAPNNNGLKLLGFKELDVKGLSEIIKQDLAVIILIGRLADHWQEILNNISSKSKLVQLTCLKNRLLKKSILELPLISIFEKSGLFVNRQKLVQKVNPVARARVGLFEECRLWKTLADSLKLEHSLPENPQESLRQLTSSQPVFSKLADTTKLNGQGTSLAANF